jgi:hypothetical protein
MSQHLSFNSLCAATMVAAIGLSAGAPAHASLIADGITYNLLESTITATEHQFVLKITGINGSTDTEGGRYGVNSLAFNETNPTNSVVTGSLSGFAFMKGGLNAMGCDGSGNFFCFKANTSPAGPALAANSELDLTFTLTVANASDFTGYDPDLKIQWLGSKSGKYDLVSQALPPQIVPLPSALALLVSGIGSVGWMRRRNAA